MDIKKIAGLVGMIAGSVFLPAQAEVIPGTKLNISFESSHIVGSGRHLNMLRVPVSDIDTGQVTYYDASFKFTLDPTDGLIFEQITSAAVSPPLFTTTSIIPGVYKSNGGYCYILENPTALSANHSLYVFKGYDEANGCTKTGFTAQITSGLGTDNPEFGHRDIVPNLKETYVYGVIAEGGNRSDVLIHRGWEAKELIGLRQTANDTLVVGLFSEGVDNDGDPTDFVEPRETLILKKLAL